MKKFRFSLETVLDYKQQVLATLQTEHGAILAQIRAQEQHIEELEAAYRHLDHEFTRRKLAGIAILDAMKYEQYLRSSERQIQEAYQHLDHLHRHEKLREKKLEGYNKAVQKSEEALIDEFVTTKRVLEAQSA